MALRKIMTEKDPALHKVCRPVTEFNDRLHRLLDDMTETLRQAKTADGSFQQTYESYVEKYQLPVPSSNV